MYNVPILTVSRLILATSVQSGDKVTPSFRHKSTQINFTKLLFPKPNRGHGWNYRWC